MNLATARFCFVNCKKFIQNFLSNLRFKNVLIDKHCTVKLYGAVRIFCTFDTVLTEPHCSVNSGTVNIFDMVCSAAELHFRRPNEFTLANRMISLKGRKGLSHAA